MSRPLRLGTRGSALAVAQTEAVAGALRAAHPGLVVAIETIRTAADRRPDAPFEALPGVGFFVKELEVALLEERIDVAVHSMKDLPTTATPGLAVCAVPRREDPRDVLVSRGGRSLAELPRGARVGTSSPRRAAFLRACRPDLVVVPLRGNVETRLRRMEDGEVDAVCLAGAGLRRLGLHDRVTEWLPFEIMLPSPGQGALAIQVRANDEEARRVAAAVSDPSSLRAVDAERAFLARLEGGCRLPAGAYADQGADGLRLRAAVAAPDGQRVIRGERQGPADEAEAIGRGLAEWLLEQGADTLVAARGAR
ncbi:MAG TPA: hydroxymethylbilane synthase [bacterium]|nr:hydroxymethylbilane synthase [bacterium]